ncbi:hypothetical protein [Modestobacter marinus]|uniref:Uncharacterized protein n=3 Tax=Modestobacter marinus TaxID=477641 RepID=A0A846LRU5_9ACTN|nr:hypothetical protein [Modestobacter marinus]NIH70246.1 hypothetical protein [Modestobacter marinus]GGL84836.1 hypothetical protein GCM10011589_46600 [Modestobacter marinus]
MSAVPTSEPGAARAFPAGRLSDFEDAGESGAQDSRYLAGLLPPRLARSRPAGVSVEDPATPAPAAEPETPDEGSAAGAAEPDTATDEQSSDGEPDVAQAAAATTSAAIDRLGADIRTTRSPHKRAGRRAGTPPAPAAAVTAPTAGDPAAELSTEAPGTEEPAGEKPGAADNKLRASNVHVPASFMPRLAKARTERKLSNGEWVIVALEATHDQLDGLIRPQPTGGSLFAPRATRAARTYDGPLTPYNIRLREADYAVIDQLVEKFGASSRGHLITVAFDAFLPDL